MDSLELLLRTDVSLDAIVPNKGAALALAADRLAENADAGYERIKSALLDREALGSTALGRGVAAPHAALHGCAQPAFAFIRLSSPVDFDAADEPGVDVVLALVWPRTDMQGLLGLLSSASRVLTDPAMLQLLRRVDAPDLIRRSIYFGVRNDMRRSAGTGSGGDRRTETCATQVPPRVRASDRTSSGIGSRHLAGKPERWRSNG